jgi:cell division protein FtsQ
VKAASVIRTRVLPGIAAAVVIAALATAAWKGYEAILAKPFERVIFTGNADKLARADLDALAERVKGKTSITAVREAARRLPWVREASVRREYPDAVEIAFETHDAVARWGDNALVSSRGEIFTAPFKGELPRFRGPDSGAPAMAAEYAGLAREIAPLAATIAELRLSPRGGWHLVLDNGLELELGRGRAEIHPRIARFAAAWPKLAAQGAETRYADLRHANGFAIRTVNLKK